jgi:hypothetical protein
MSDEPSTGVTSSDYHTCPSNCVAAMAQQHRREQFRRNSPAVADEGERPLIFEYRPRFCDVMPALDRCGNTLWSGVGIRHSNFVEDRPRHHPGTSNGGARCDLGKHSLRG